MTLPSPQCLPLAFLGEAGSWHQLHCPTTLVFSDFPVDRWLLLSHNSGHLSHSDISSFCLSLHVLAGDQLDLIALSAQVSFSQNPVDHLSLLIKCRPFSSSALSCQF